MTEALYFETYNGSDFYRDKYGNVYTKVGQETAFCSNLKHGRLTEDKAEPSYPVRDVMLVGGNNG